MARNITDSFLVATMSGGGSVKAGRVGGWAGGGGRRQALLHFPTFRIQKRNRGMVAAIADHLARVVPPEISNGNQFWLIFFSKIAYERT